MPPRARYTIVAAAATMLASCTNDYGDFRIPRTPPGNVEPGPEAGSTGGAQGSGGATASGGGTSSGGAPSSGGTQSSGGATGSGGAAPEGGTPEKAPDSGIADAALDVTGD